MARNSLFAVPQKQVAGTLSLPSPTGGLNARDSLALMKMDQAIVLQNMFPLQYGVQVRKGWLPWATGLPGPVETLLTFAATDGTQKLFAASGNSFYDVTLGGPVGAPAVSGFINNRWQWTPLVNTFGNFLVCVNGDDEPRKFNGTAWSVLNITANAGTYPGFVSNSLIHVQLAHRRLWFVERNSGAAWYLPVDAMEGEVSRFHVGELFPRGGPLQAIGVWSIDSGSGMDDHTVFISANGDVAIYKGFDPDDAENFLLVGVYQIGPSIGRRCYTKMGGDLLILCEDGVTPLSAVLSQSRAVSQASVLSGIIQQKLNEDIVAFRGNFGWSIDLCPRYQFLTINVPTHDVVRQYAMNIVTGAWCEFTGFAARCWGLLDANPYFGADGEVRRAWVGDTDNGAVITSTALQAYSYFGNQAQQKRWTMVRPVFNAVNAPALRQTLLVDFSTEDTMVGPSLTISSTLGAAWDIDAWDASVWAGGVQSIKRWASLGRIGYAGAYFIKMATMTETTWVATDFIFEGGGPL